MIPNHPNYHHSDQMMSQDVRHNTPHHVQSPNQTGGSPFVHKPQYISIHSNNLPQTAAHQPEQYNNTHQTTQFPFVSPTSGRPSPFPNSSISNSTIVQSNRPVINHYPLPSTTTAGHLSQTQSQLQSFTSSQSQHMSQHSQFNNHPLSCSLNHGSIIKTTPPPVQQQIRFYGHELKPSITISSESCLIGCVFYISPTYSKNQNTENLISGWKRSMIKFGAKIVDNLQSNNEIITHIVTEYIDLKSKQDIDKRYVSIFWLNEVLEKRRLLPPWRFYHLPLTFNPQSAPCKHHVRNQRNFCN